MVTAIDIPKRALFRAAEVCTIAKVQPYVLKSWEAEFEMLGATKGVTRVYRRSDVEMVLEIKRLLYEEGLTLGAARRKLGADQLSAGEEKEETIAELLGQDASERIVDVKKGLRSILDLLSANGERLSKLHDLSDESSVIPSESLSGVVKKRRGLRKPRGSKKS